MSLLDDNLSERSDKEVLILSLKNISEIDIPAWIQAWRDEFMDMLMNQETGRSIYKLLCLYELCVLNQSYRTYKSKYNNSKNVFYTMYVPNRQRYIDEWKEYAKSYLDHSLFQEMILSNLDIDDMMIGLFGVFDCHDLGRSEFVKKYYVALQHSYNDIEIIEVNSKYDQYKGFIKSLYSLK